MKINFKLMAILLVFTLCFGENSKVLASEINNEQAGTKPVTQLLYDNAGLHITMEVLSDGTVYFTGYGDMFDYEKSPLLPYKDIVREIRLSDRITYIGANVFSEIPIKNITIPKAIRAIGEGAFKNCKSLLSPIDIPDDIVEIAPESFDDWATLAVTQETVGYDYALERGAHILLKIRQNVKYDVPIARRDDNIFTGDGFYFNAKSRDEHRIYFNTMDEDLIRMSGITVGVKEPSGSEYFFTGDSLRLRFDERLNNYYYSLRVFGFGYYQIEIFVNSNDIKDYSKLYELYEPLKFNIVRVLEGGEVPYAVWRNVNPYTGEHMLYSDYKEYEYANRNGCTPEGVIFYSLEEDEEDVMPIYRLLSPGGGEHMFTTDIVEKETLVSLGFIFEGEPFYVANEGSPIYRLVNSTNGLHHFTDSKREYNALKKIGWIQEGIAFYAAL